VNPLLARKNTRPLAGRRVVVTRARERAAELISLLEQAGAEVVAIPLIEIADPLSWSDADQALNRLEKFDFVVFTSANAVSKWLDHAVARNQRPVRPGQKISAVGDATARSLKEHGIRVDLMPKKFSATGLLEALDLDLHGKRFLLPRGDLARPDLSRELRARGADVFEALVYRTLPASLDSDEWIRRIAQGEVDVITFASPSAVHHFVEWLGPGRVKTARIHFRAASIGPTTSASLREHGLEVAIEAHPSTMPALCDAIATFFQPS
jgi:uroporphyrinogen III methyltransferase/synthase